MFSIASSQDIALLSLVHMTFSHTINIACFDNALMCNITCEGTTLFTLKTNTLQEKPVSQKSS